MKKIALTSLLLAFMTWSLGCARRNAAIEIPEGYVGWVTIEYDAESCEFTSKSAWVSVIRATPDGWGCTSTWNGAEGLSIVKYFYVDRDGRRIRPLQSTGWGEGGEIWAEANVADENIAHFFVGSEDAFKATKIGPHMADRLRNARRKGQ